MASKNNLIKPPVVLAVVCACCCGLLAVANSVTKDKIAAAEAASIQTSLQQLPNAGNFTEVSDFQPANNEKATATAVYVDDSLRFVTTEGDHLRTYLESIKAPYVNAMDQNKRVSFVHDIKLVDGIYLLSSILDYNNVISTLNQGGGPTYYTAAAGDTVQTVVDNTGVSWLSLIHI